MSGITFSYSPEEIKIEYSEDDKSVMYVDYGAKVRAKFSIEYEQLNDEQRHFIMQVIAYVRETVNIKALLNLDDRAFFRLIERLVRSIGGMTKYKQVYGLDKSIVRSYVLLELEHLKLKHSNNE